MNNTFYSQIPKSATNRPDTKGNRTIFKICTLPYLRQQYFSSNANEQRAAMVSRNNSTINIINYCYNSKSVWCYLRTINGFLFSFRCSMSTVDSRQTIFLKLKPFTMIRRCELGSSNAIDIHFQSISCCALHFKW